MTIAAFPYLLFPRRHYLLLDWPSRVVGFLLPCLQFLKSMAMALCWCCCGAFLSVDLRATVSQPGNRGLELANLHCGSSDEGFRNACVVFPGTR